MFLIYGNPLRKDKLLETSQARRQALEESLQLHSFLGGSYEVQYGTHSLKRNTALSPKLFSHREGGKRRVEG